MPFANSLAQDVSAPVRARGRAYFLSGAVRIVEGDSEHVEARVRGSQLYHVNLEREGFAVVARCTCPYCDDQGLPCKHIWATVLKADQLGYLKGNRSNDPTELFIEDYGDDDDEPYTPMPRVYPVVPKLKQAKAPKGPNWKQEIKRLKDTMQTSSRSYQGDDWPPGREVLYVIDHATSLTQRTLTVELAHRQRKKNGDWSKPKVQGISAQQIAHIDNPEDRLILSMLTGAQTSSYGYGYSSYGYGSCRYQLPQAMQALVLPRMCQTGRCLLRLGPDDLRPMQWDDGPPWEFWIDVHRDEKAKHYRLRGELRRGDERMDVKTPLLLPPGGPVVTGTSIASLKDDGAAEWMKLLRQHKAFTIPFKEGDALLGEVLKLPVLPRLQLPDELKFEEVTAAPRPCLKVKKQEGYYSYQAERLVGELSFDYDGIVVPESDAGSGVYQPEQRRLIRRDLAAEQAAKATLQQLHVVGNSYQPTRFLAPRNLPSIVRTLTDAGWRVEAEGKIYRTPGEFNLKVSSGIDWFELHGTVQFGDQEASLPELLKALKKGDTSIRLDDGTVGMLPQDWLKKYGVLAGLGKTEGDHLRFTRSQVGLLDALLAAQPEASFDLAFEKARDELRRFEGVQPADPPPDFVGQLRAYQRDGLGWLHFLNQFGFGGCLADDMGLGKTVQVLALLEARRALREQQKRAGRIGPSLVVVPRSLIFNWKQEAARFTPKLRVLDHTGLTRAKENTSHFDDYDLVLTTYGTLRRDALLFKDRTFDYAILDEAQAVKNSNTESAKAVRLLQANHRLAMSGTPIENHLGELWSLFEFLNPGMLGAASVFRLGGAGARNPSEDTRVLLARALRPFILRRTKAQVAKDLPQKTEQDLFCELEPEQRKLYDQLREHYRTTLLDGASKLGLGKMKIQVLEALLRLRQAACHPGLIDPKKADKPSAKLDVLLPQLTELTEEGQKVLVFSQFTSFLAIVRKQLDTQKIPYEYLDGKTRDRQARVERFQNDPDCKLFLISLKAGGLGLNLTAAEYVFLLDPWWNPAVEAQAIDRAHRIGQTKPVFAYRLIARDTVEEKVLQLQQTKKALADAIISADNSLIRDLSRDDLELLLS